MLTTIWKTVMIALTFAISLRGQVVSLDFASHRSFACVVIDAKTSEPLSSATLRAGKYGWSADSRGRIEALVNVGDTLVFTHVGYQPAILEVKESHFTQNVVAVKLSPDTVFLSEVVVKPRRLTLAQEAQLAAMKKEANYAVAKTVFKNSTYEALTRNFAMDASDNQQMLMDNHISRMVNGGSTSFGSISLSLTKLIGLFSHRNKPHKTYNTDDGHIRPLSEEELIEIITWNQRRSQKETPDSMQLSGDISMEEDLPMAKTISSPHEH